LLQQHEVTVVADVRSSPYSRYLPHVNREEIIVFLKASGIGYVFLGEELGARRSEPECYNGETAEYCLIAETESFRSGIDRLLTGAESHRICMMCSEKDPLTCHRTILVSRWLQDKHGCTIEHILEDGSVETQAEAVSRLLKECKRENLEMFSDREERIKEVYEERANEIQYKRIVAGDEES